MAKAPAQKGQFGAGFDFKGLPGSTSWGSQAFYRKTATLDARQAMKEIIGEYSKLISNVKNATPEILEQSLKPIFKRAQYLVPEDTGALWESGALTSGRGSDGKAFASITFGNEEAWYAAIVHEYTWLKHESPTQAKYLQTAMEEGISGLPAILKANFAGLI